MFFECEIWPKTMINGKLAKKLVNIYAANLIDQLSTQQKNCVREKSKIYYKVCFL